MKFGHISDKLGVMSLVGTEFARSHMEGKGWNTGEGLGRHGQGIVDAIKPKLKFDQTGVGHNRSVFMTKSVFILKQISEGQKSLSSTGGIMSLTRQLRVSRLRTMR